MTQTTQPTPPPLAAVIFDVDGTLVDSERDGHRVAFNAAFEEFGLDDRWSVDYYGELLHTTGGVRRITRHLVGRGMDAEEAEALARPIHARKTALFQEMIADGLVDARPGVDQLFADLEAVRVRLGVATTGARAWVQPLLDRLFGPGRFEVVVTRDEAPDLKPDPSAYVIALDALGLAPEAVLSVEDSRNGLVAAQRAALPCVVVVNDYTADQDFSGAELVLDGFGGAGAPARTLRDPHGLRPARLDAATLRAVQALRDGVAGQSLSERYSSPS